MSDGAVVRVLTGRGSRPADREALVAFVAEVTDTDPALVRVVRRCPHCGAADHGRPTALVDGRHLAVSLSRTTGVLALALGPTTSGPGSIGVDVERPSRVAAAPLDVSTPGEQERAARSGSVAVHRTACWAVKEAVLKRDGRGLRVDPSAVDAVLGPIADAATGSGATETGPGTTETQSAGHTARFDGVMQPVTVLRLDDDLVLAVAAGGSPVAVQDRRDGPHAHDRTTDDASPATRSPAKRIAATRTGA
ncbi:4'-phosphopantetheinyl transferase family protein [Curtobacterium herbarum]|uniref:4'-phosphopantetheinyl transferase domain-containing protein n=1 Tax=Curtobacterium herbarum TaxID=150122 RepID=A0ABN1ZA26_9MICO|nr:4'-phosphopantetheinyl transferase superfamily protein [Curtobacterium herbarum]MBM7475211.1 4'-phosphopantetheinyl transferase [Curtobacterium herbarum]MCS6543127.1 4'-phosphopantetheinyl transferase superfamily protein [Curtobacterium herbarum]